MKLCYLELHIWDFYVDFLQIGTVKMLDIECGGSLGCVEVIYTTDCQGILSKVILQWLKYMKLCYLELRIWDFYVEFLQIGMVKMLDIECGGSLGCVEVKYTTHSQRILSKVILQ